MFEEACKQLRDSKLLASSTSAVVSANKSTPFEPGEWKVVEEPVTVSRPILKIYDDFGPTQHEPGAKLDGAKPDLSLLLMFSRALNAVGVVSTAGAKKYTRGGWQHVDDGFNRYTAAMLRHTMTDEEYDEDIRQWATEEVLHEASAAWNALARLELKLREKEDEGKRKIPRVDGTLQARADTQGCGSGGCSGYECR